jgi:tetratricopeptide (TPR) repeat protein
MACDPEGELRAQVGAWLAEALSYQIKDEQALRWARTAHSEAPAQSEAWWRAYQVLAISALRLGLPEARQIAKQVLDLPLEFHATYAATALGLVAGSLASFGHLDLAEQFLNRILKSGESIGHAPPEALYAQSTLLCESAPGQSIRLLRQAIHGHRQAGGTRDLVHCLFALGQYLLQLGAADEAESCLLEELELAHRTKNTWCVAIGRNLLGAVAFCRAQYAAAEQHLEQAIELLAKLGSPHGQSDPHRWLARALHAQKKATAREHALLAAELSRTDPVLQAAALAVLGLFALEQGAHEEALQRAEEAHLLYQRHPSGENSALVRRVYLEALFANGRCVEGEQALLGTLAWLQQRAASLETPEHRRGFLTNVPDNVAILQLAEQWLPQAAITLREGLA